MINSKVTINFDSNISKVEKEFDDRKQDVLYAIGLKWQSIVNKIITREDIVDSGRLRSSMTFITPTRVGEPITSGSKAADRLTGKAPDNSVIVGTNVEYAG